MSSRSFPEMNSSITCLERSRKTWLHNQQFFSSNRFLCTKRLPKALASCAARPKSMSLIFNEPIARFSLDKFLHGLEGSLWGCRKPIPTKCWLLETSPSDRDACRWKHAPTCASHWFAGVECLTIHESETFNFILAPRALQRQFILREEFSLSFKAKASRKIVLLKKIICHIILSWHEWWW